MPGFPKFDFKPVGLLEVIAKKAVFLLIEPIMLSTKPLSRALSGFWLM